MKNKWKCAFIALFGLSLGVQATFSSLAAKAENRIDLFTNKSDWVVQENLGSTKFNDEHELEIIGVGSASTGAVNTAVYTRQKFGSGKIAFDFTVEFGEGVDKTDYHAGSEWLVSCFFGVMFLQNVEVNNPTGSVGVPWDTPGGYPYMLCFDTETSGGEANRAKQLGLTLRRYKFSGSHNYTRWSTVEPTNETFYNSLGEAYESKVPDFYKPVTTEMIWDGKKHSVALEWGNLSVADGDEVDAVKIEAWYDGEKVMTVIDEMPFMGEKFGEEVPVDKRDMNGYVAWYCFHDNSSPSLEAYSYLLRVSSMTIEPGPDNVPQGDTPPDSSSDGVSAGNASENENPAGCGSGCKGVISSSVLLLGALAAGGAALFIKKKER